MTQYAVLSSDANPTYCFFAPLTCAVWKERGYTPLLLLVGDEAKWVCDRRLRIVYDHCVKAGARVFFIDGHAGHRPATVAQVSRLFAFHHAFADDYLLTSDIDMWPLGPWVGGARDDAKALHLYYANAHDDEGRVHYPMCYIGGTAATWREIMLGGHSRALGAALDVCAARPPTPRHKNLVHRVGADVIPLDVWNFDETYFGECLSAWSGYPERCQMIARDMERDAQRRIDRSSWKDAPALEPYADAHLLRPGFTETHWPQVHRLFARVVPARGMWAKKYRDELVDTIRAEQRRTYLVARATTARARGGR